MDKLKIKDGSFTVSRTILVVFTAILMMILPQLNCPEYVLPTITSKLIYFLYGSLVLLVLYTLNIFFSKKIVFKFSGIDVALFILVLYITINRYFIQSHYGFSIRYIELLGLCFFYIVLRHISLKNYPWLLLSIVISGIIQAIYGNLQLFGYYTSNHSGFKMTGSFFNPGPYAGFLVSVWSVALGMYLFKDNIIIQIQSHKKNTSLFLNTVIKHIFEYITLIGIISIALVLPAIQSRASWLAVLSSSLILLELRYVFLKKLFKTVNAFKRACLIIVSLIILSFGLFGIYQLKKGSSDGRLFIWKITTEMIAVNPVFGLGFDRFQAEYMNYQANYFAKNGETTEEFVADNVYYSFNEWLQFFSENGLVGLLLLTAVIVCLFKAKIKEENKGISNLLKNSILAIGTFAFFSYPMQILPVKLVLVMILALLGSLDLSIYKLNFPYNNISYSAYKTVFLVVIIIGINKANLYINKLDNGFKTWQSACDPFLDYVTALKEYEMVYPIFKNEGDFLMNYGKTLSLAENNSKAITILKRAKHHLNNIVIQTALGDAYKGTKQYKKAETAYKQAYYMSPSRFYPLYLLAKLYDESDNKKKAVVMANNLLHKRVKIPSAAIKEIRAEMENILIKYKNIQEFQK